MSAAPARPLPILCALIGHRAERSQRWNEGFYFARCRRCGRDLVRTAYGRWHEPVGARVVWSPRRPEWSPSAALVVEPPASPAEALEPVRAATPPGEELPIEEVLRHLKRSDDGARAASAPPRPRGRTYIPDFMADASVDTSWRTNRPANRPPSPGAEESGPPPAPDNRTGTGTPGKNLARIGNLARQPVALAATGVVVLLLLLIGVAGNNRPAAQPRQAIVAADILDCRDAPLADAPLVTQLLRGDRVEILARREGWTGIAYGPTRCWARAGDLAAGVPL